MFKVLIVYPLVAFILLWICSDTKINASLYKFEDNYVEIHFPRAEWSDEYLFEWVWNAQEIHQDVKELNQ